MSVDRLLAHLAELAAAGLSCPSNRDRFAAESVGWFKGPPYAIAEMVFDEDDLAGCDP